MWIILIFAYNPQIMTIIRGLYQSDHNPHEHELLALHQVRSFKRKTSKIVLFPLQKNLKLHWYIGCLCTH